MKSPMRQLVLAMVLGLQGGEPGDAMQLYRDGRFAEAAAAIRAAIERSGDTAELQWNLALASWRAGDLVAAETAAEKYAAMSKQARSDLHAGLLGAVRHAEAKALEQQADQLAAQPPTAAAAPDSAPPADPLPVLEQALQKATQAKDWFVRGAAAKATPELLRNAERSLRTIDELQHKIDELKKQREQQKKDDEQQKDDEKKNEDKKDDENKDEKQEKKEPKPDEQPEQKPEEKGEQQEQPPQGDEKPEPKPGQDEQQKDAAKQGDGSGKAPPQGEPKGEAGERSDAPGEAREDKELTPEQVQRLLEQLRKTDDKAKEIRSRAKTARRVVERDW